MRWKLRYILVAGDGGNECVMERNVWEGMWEMETSLNTAVCWAVPL